MHKELQYIFPIEKNASFKEEDYIISPCNKEAHSWVENWPDWGDSSYSNLTFLFGDKFSGKSHLASIWRQHSDAKYIDTNFILNKEYQGKKSNYIIENLELNPEIEVALFHFINYLVESKDFLLITSRVPQSNLGCSLKDLDSRLKAFSAIKIHDPDDDLVEKIIVKYFSDFQVVIGQEVVKFLQMRIERSYQRLFSILAQLNEESLSQKKKISVNFIKQVLKI